MPLKILRAGVLVGGVLAGSMLVSDAAFASVTNNTNPLPAGYGFGNGAAQPSLVKNAKVTLMATDLWNSGSIFWSLLTTDAGPRVVGDGNECSTDNPLKEGDIFFFVSAEAAATDNKLQKLMSLLQTSQLTGMQVSVSGIAGAVTGSTNADCVVGKISLVYLRNTTF